MLNFVSKLFGSSNKNKIKSYSKLIEKINDLEVNIINLSDEDLKSKTKYFIHFRDFKFSNGIHQAFLTTYFNLYEYFS